MIQEVQFLQSLHNSTKRDYLARMTSDKPECCAVARQYGADYWDGDRRYGYGGYKYDGRYAPVARELIAYYDLKPNMRVLDIGCGKGFLLHEMACLRPDIAWYGIDISSYAINESQHLKPHLYVADARDIPYQDGYFDFVLSTNLMHNFSIRDLKQAINELMRVSKSDAKRYLCVESWRNEQEKMNLQAWALTAESFHDTGNWKWLLNEFGYLGDVEYIVFE